MLEERHLLIASLILALLGLGALLILQQTLELPVEHLTKVEKGNDQTIRIRATVTKSRLAGNVTLLTLREQVERSAVIFAPVNISEGEEIEAYGTVTLYKGEPELVIERLEVR